MSYNILHVVKIHWFVASHVTGEWNVLLWSTRGQVTSRGVPTVQ